jgi:hypothetical protein
MRRHGSDLAAADLATAAAAAVVVFSVATVSRMKADMAQWQRQLI